MDLDENEETRDSTVNSDKDDEIDDLTDAEYVPEKEDITEHEKTRRQTSAVWKYFKKVSDTMAQCPYCDKILSFKTSVSNLMKHLRCSHSNIKQDWRDSDGTDADLTNIEVNPENQSNNGKLRSEIWKYFDMKDRAKKIATCNLCRKHFSYQTISNLKKHVIRAHSKTSSLSNDEQEEHIVIKRPLSNTSATQVQPQRRNRFRSTLWRFFTVLDAKTKIAKCRLCSSDFSYNCLSNLKKHLERKHGGVLEVQSSDEGLEEEVEAEQNNAVWAYFKCLDEGLKIASCLICKKRVDYNDERDLSKHLTRKHPRVDLDGLRTTPKKLMITENGDLYEIDDSVVKPEPISVSEQEENDSNDWSYDNSEPDALNTEYLNEDAFVEPQPVPTKKKPKLSSHRSQNIILQRTNDDASLDIFGKYIVVLLKKLPKHKSDKLQAEFVRQIMEAQLNDHDDNKCCKPSCIQNNRYASQSIDDTLVTSNSEVKKVVTSDGRIEDTETNNVTSVAEEITKIRT